MTDYTKLNGPELLLACGDSGDKWATAFCQYNPDIEVDQHVLMGWFANAIEHSHDIRTCSILNGEHAQYLLDNGLQPNGQPSVDNTGHCDDHEWVSMDNAYIVGGEMCLTCHQNGVKNVPIRTAKQDIKKD